MASFQGKIEGKPSDLSSPEAFPSLSLDGARSNAANASNASNVSNSNTCRDFQKGACSRGDRCKYSHSTPNGAANANKKDATSPKSPTSKSGGARSSSSWEDTRSKSDTGSASPRRSNAPKSDEAALSGVGYATADNKSNVNFATTTAATTTTTTTAANANATGGISGGNSNASPTKLELVMGGALSEPRKKTEIVQEMHMQMIRTTNHGKGGTLLLGDSLTERLVTERQPRLSDLTRRNVFIAGCGGDNIQNACWRVDMGIVRATAPSHVIVFIGTNNIGSTPIDDFRPLFLNLLETIRKEAGPACLISCIGVCGRSDLLGRMHTEYVESVNVIQKEVCDSLGIAYYKPFIEFYDKLLFKDHIHFSPRGFDRMIDFVISIL